VDILPRGTTVVKRLAGVSEACLFWMEASEASRVTGSQTTRARRWVLRGPRCRPPILRDLSLNVLRQLPFHGIHARSLEICQDQPQQYNSILVSFLAQDLSPNRRGPIRSW
jgi:hypothetical protein